MFYAFIQAATKQKNILKYIGYIDIFCITYLYILVSLVLWQRFNHYFDFFCVFFGSNEIKCTFVTLLIQKTNFNFNLIHYENNQNKRNKQFKELH